MSNRFTNTIPSINRSLQSPNFITQGLVGVSNRDSDYHFTGCEFTANVPVGQFQFPLGVGEQTTAINDFSNFTSNSMIPSSAFNIIKVDYLNGESEVDLKVLYSFENDLRKSQVGYSTTIKPNELFYRNFPVQNRNFSIALENKDEGATATGSGIVTLSRYTQYNTPAQSNDVIDHTRLVNLERDTNDFLQDVVLGRFDDIKKTDRIGILPEVGALQQTIWDNPSAFDFTSNTNRNCVVFSSSNADVGDVLISGLGEGNLLVSDNVTLTGTSNVITITDFKAVTDMRASTTNEGKITIADANTGEVMNVMDAEAGRSTTLAYTPNVLDTGGKAVVLDLNINGVAGLLNEPKLSIYKVDSTKQKTLLHKDLTYDNTINKNIPLNLLVNRGEIVYGEVTSNGLSGSLGHTSYSATMNIIEYS